VRAVDGVGFSIRRGEIFALLGPNGAGKTSTVRMLIGQTRPDSGSIRYRSEAGALPEVPPKELGYLPEERGLYLDQTVLRTLVYLAQLRGMDAKTAQNEALGWLERLSLSDRAREKISALSKGNQQKVQLIAAILHRPRFAILDEPFSGFDPINQELALNLIRELRDSGMTVLLSAHQMQLVERLADRILLLNRGRAVLGGTMAELRRDAGLSQRLTLSFAAAQDASALREVPGVVAVEQLNERQAALLLSDGTPLNPVLCALGAGATLVDVQSDPVGLHEIYLRAVGGAAQEVVR
jgi:ABC-2 type transport system ATP-binding protein